MLICNNCGCVHQQQVTICTQCRIPGDFTITPDQQHQAPVTESVMCVNCGNHIGSDLLRCPECRFPLDKSARHQTDKNLSPFTRNLKTG